MSETEGLAIPTRGEDGTPICPVCETPVAEVGHFCSSACYQHFVSVVESQQIVIMSEWVDIWNQPWHTE